MPQTEVKFYCDIKEDSPVLNWLDQISPRMRAVLTVRINQLSEQGFLIPANYGKELREGIWELRARERSVHYRILFFFAGRGVAVLTNGCTKEDIVPEAEIRLAKSRRTAYLQGPDIHTYHEGEDDEQN